MLRMYQQQQQGAGDRDNGDMMQRLPWTIPPPGSVNPNDLYDRRPWQMPAPGTVKPEEWLQRLPHQIVPRR
jgi:hypothetical protein